MSEQEPDADLLSPEDLLEVAAGVLDEVVVRRRGLLVSTAGRPRTSVFGQEAYPRLLINGHDLDCSVDDAEALVLAVATGELDVPDLASSMVQHLH